MRASSPLWASALDFIDGHEPSPTEGAWCFVLMDFVMFHELGHIFYGDGPDFLNKDGIEERANEFATRLFGLTWGFRNRDMTLREAPAAMASAGGPLAFIAATTLVLASQAYIAKRVADIKGDERRRRTASAYERSFISSGERNTALLKNE